MDWAGLSTLLVAVDCLLLLAAVDVVVPFALLVTVDCVFLIAAVDVVLPLALLATVDCVFLLAAVDCVFLFVDGAVDAAVLPAAD